jgi:hypothetical protein
MLKKIRKESKEIKDLYKVANRDRKVKANLVALAVCLPFGVATGISSSYFQNKLNEGAAEAKTDTERNIIVASYITASFLVSFGITLCSVVLANKAIKPILK